MWCLGGVTFSLCFRSSEILFLHPTKVESGKQLESVSRLKLYRYQYRDGVMTGAVPSDEEKRLQVGVLAQELRQILPEAVHETVSHPYNY